MQYSNSLAILELWWFLLYFLRHVYEKSST